MSKEGYRLPGVSLRDFFDGVKSPVKDCLERVPVWRAGLMGRRHPEGVFFGPLAGDDVISQARPLAIVEISQALVNRRLDAVRLKGDLCRLSGPGEWAAVAMVILREASAFAR